jgi:alkanesulfonate monooxygenase SsuD/methylene tetrahydromethanopterin reductase-like flavin-dependent oxidoreductase (luciferase family)
MNQFFGNNRFKFALFGLNCSGGMTPSCAKERWRADWDEIVQVAYLADKAGIEILLPIAKWRGLGGKTDMWGRSFETFSQAAALGAITQYIGIFVTAHVSLITPAFAAKSIATIDHITHGRAGLNIVCGWNPDEFSLHGVTIDGERRYERGRDWFHIYDRLLEGGPEFDWTSEFFNMTGLATNPLPIQRRPPVMSAAQSGDGQIFAAEAADILFTSVKSLNQGAQTLARLRGLAQTYGRTPDVYIETQLVCKPTRKEAQEYAHYYAVEMADSDALAYFAKQRASTMSKSTKAGETNSDRVLKEGLSQTSKPAFPGMFPGMYPIIGTPDDMVTEFEKLANVGIAGSTLVFLNYLQELPFFVQEVFPRMERVGLRMPLTLSHGRPAA